MATKESYSLNILSIFLLNIEDAFFKPNGITSHSKCPSGHEKVVQGLCILTCQNPDLLSNLLNTLQFLIFPSKYSLVGISYPSSSVLSYLLGKIKICNIFSKFDYKSGFWQVKMHKDSIPWTTFSCLEGHFELLVMSFGLKKCILYISKKNG